MRPISASAFVAGNFLYVYKNCAQLADIEKQNELNDVLFSHSLHPNSGAEFSLLFSVIAHQPDDYSCPICLYPPCAPRITHCGHIFCAECISQHISICEDPVCPVCYKKLTNFPIIRADLRLYPSNNHFLFRKILRNHKNCVCFRSDDQNLFNLPYASQLSAPFCHFMLADKTYVSKVLDKEKTELLKQIDIFKNEYDDEFKVSFIQEVYDKVLAEVPPEDDGPSFFLQESPKPSDYFRYYQETYGRLIYFDPLTVKMLSAQFGSLADAPDIIEVDALKTQTIPVDQHFRDSHRSLGHLPAGADVTFVLADLSKIVSSDVMEAFSKQIEKRVKVEEEDVGVEEEAETLTEADFPAMFAKRVPTRQSSQPSGWTNVKMDETRAQTAGKKTSLESDFPSFGSSGFKKKAAWGAPPPQQQQQTQQTQQQTQLPQQKMPQRQSSAEFPSFGDLQRKPK